MLYQTENEFGVISIDNTFIHQMLKDSIKPFENDAWIAHYKKNMHFDFFFKSRNIDSMYDFQVSDSDKGILFRTFIIIKFGQSFSNITSYMLDYIADILKNDLCLPIDNIEVCVSGVVSGKTLVKRNIVYKYIDDEQN